MSESDKIFAGSIPDVYDDYLVPLIFEAYAADMARRLAPAGPSAVLETAAGSGVVARALAPLLKADARYVVSDLNQPMLDRAARRQGADGRIEWLRADALALPFEDESFDAVCCQFGMMFFPDRVAGYREARRVLRDGGRFVFSVWDRLAENHLAASVNATVARLYPENPSHFMERTPHGYHDTARIAEDLRAAGFADIEISTVPGESRAETPRHAAVAFCQGTPLRNELEARGRVPLDRVTDEAEADLRRAYGAGPISAKMQAHVVTAVK
jgi:ubiquinone/menaquinone biosynthesis C-methylase UbiE